MTYEIKIVTGSAMEDGHRAALHLGMRMVLAKDDHGRVWPTDTCGYCGGSLVAEEDGRIWVRGGDECVGDVDRSAGPLIMRDGVLCHECQPAGSGTVISAEDEAKLFGLED